MIYVTGDTHIPYDINKLSTKYFPEQKSMTKDDYVIICGDFGGVWNGSKEEMFWRKWLNNKSFTTLYVDGNHENFNMLKEFEIKEWKGGKVQFINDSVIHLMRGQVFTIDGLKFFTMGGGTSIDKMFRTEGISWWPEEQPSKKEYNEAIENLDKNNWQVDYVITHTMSTRRMKELSHIKEESMLNKFFDILEDRLVYKHWYSGHFHEDTLFDDKKHTILFNTVTQIKQ
jgi:predicted phosphodiesterase